MRRDDLHPEKEIRVAFEIAIFGVIIMLIALFITEYALVALPLALIYFVLIR